MLRGFNFGKDCFQSHRNLTNFALKVDIKIRNLMNRFNLEELKLECFWN